jgi:hypothetical protein
MPVEMAVAMGTVMVQRPHEDFPRDHEIREQAL